MSSRDPSSLRGGDVPVVRSLSTSLPQESSPSLPQTVRSDRNDRIHRILAGGGDERVELYGNDGTCRLRTSLDTLYSGELVASGAMFSVTAKESLEIISFEFASFSIGNDLHVEVYTIQGADYLSVNDQADRWIMIGKTEAAIETIDGLGMIVPRADMLRAIQMLPGDTRSFYFTLKSQHLKLEGNNGATTGQLQLEDDMLQLNVGVSLRVYPFPELVDMDRSFQGKIHYHSFQPCDDFSLESTDAVFSFASNSNDIGAVNLTLTDGLRDMLQDDPELERYTQVHGLQLQTLQAKSRGVGTDCMDLGLEDGCELYDGQVSFQHYKSLSSKELELELIASWIERNGTKADDVELFYIGDQVLSQDYDIMLSGVPNGTILNPIQREYIESVTFDFLESFADVKVYRVEVIGQQLERRNRRYNRRQLNLRGGGGRHLQSTGAVTVESTIYGIGDDAESYFDEIDKAFSVGGLQYNEALIKEQYLPGAINDGQDFGGVFADLFRATVTRPYSNETRAPDPATGVEDTTNNSKQIQIIVFSVVLALSFLYLIYRCSKDLLLVKDGTEIKTQKLSEKLEDQGEKNQKELEKMDEPREPKRGVRKSNSFGGFEAFQGFKTAPDPEKPERRKLKEPTRGVGKANTFSGVDGFFGSKPSFTSKDRSDAAPQRNRSEPIRGVRKSNTFSGTAGFFGSNPTSAEDAQTVSSETKSREARGVRKRNSFTGASSTTMPVRAKSDLPPRTPVRNPEIPKGRTKTREKRDPNKPPSAKSAADEAPQRNRSEPIRGVRKSNTFSGIGGSYGSNPISAEDAQTVSSETNSREARGVRKRNSFTGASSATMPVRAKSDMPPRTPVFDRSVSGQNPEVPKGRTKTREKRDPNSPKKKKKKKTDKKTLSPGDISSVTSKTSKSSTKSGKKKSDDVDGSMKSAKSVKSSSKPAKSKSEGSKPPKTPKKGKKKGPKKVDMTGSVSFPL